MSYVGKVNTGQNDHLVAASVFGTCSTAADVAAKIVVLDNFDALMNGVTIQVKFVYSNTASNPTLNVNNTGAKPIYLNGTNPPGSTALLSWSANSVLSFTCDGTAWIMNDVNKAVVDAVDRLNAGYNPVSKTSGMTKAVGNDSEGKLWTEPVEASEVQTAANTWLSANITNPDSPPLDRSLSSNASAAPADMVGDLKNTFNKYGKDSDLGYLSFESDGKYLDYSAVEGSNSMLSHTDFIDVPPFANAVVCGNKTVSDDGQSSYHIFPNILFFDQNKALITYGSNSTDDIATYQLPAGTKYIKVNQPSASNPDGISKVRGIWFKQFGYVGGFLGTVGSSATQVNTGIILTAYKSYIIKINNEITSGRLNMYINGDPYVIAYAYSEGHQYFTPKTSGALYIYNPGGTYSGALDVDVYEANNLLAKQNITPTIYEVGSSKGWKSLTALLYALKNDSSEKIIYVDGGDYNIFSEYTDLGLLSGEAPSNPTFDYFDYNVWVPTNTHIIGRGQVRLLWQPTTEQISVNWSKTISPLNCAGTATIENIEIHCKNGRYCIHDDALGKGAYFGAIKKYINVKCYKYNNDEGYGFSSCIGFGLDPDMTYDFEECYFEHIGNDTVFYMHSRADADFPTNITNSPTVIVKNSIMKTTGYGFRLGNVANNTAYRIPVLFAGCYVGGSGRICDEASSAQGNYQNVFDVKLLRCNAVTVNVISTVNPYPVQVF